MAAAKAVFLTVPLFCLVLLVMLITTVASPTAHAQNGQIVDGIFRSMYEAQAERDRQAAQQRQAAAGARVEPVPRTNPSPAQGGSSAPLAWPPQTTSPSQLNPPGSTFAQPASSVSPGGVITRPGDSLSANWFMDSLAAIRDQTARLIPELQRYSVSVPAAREVIADAYQINVDANTLHARTRGGEPIQSIFVSYQQMDLRWRDVSYRLRAGGLLDSRVSNLVGVIDELFQSTDKRLGLTPPIDRVRLRDLMIVTLTYMDAMFDDVRLSPNAFQQSEALIREGRILRERLRQEFYKIDRADYDQVVSSFTDFVQQWRTYATKLYALNDAHVNQRLDSIRQQGDQVYASLRIQAATDRRQMQFAAQRLTAALTAVQDQLTRWGLSRLPADQARFADTVRTLIDRSRYLEAELARGGALTTAATQFSEMDRIWTDGLRSMRAVDPRSGLQASLVQCDALMVELRDLLQLGPWQGMPSYVQAAASLEAAADDFNNDVQRFKRYLTPNAYKDTLSQVSDDLFDISRNLHRTLDERSDLREASRLTQQLVERWQQLSPMLNELQQRGLSAGRSEQLIEDYRLMQPLVAQAAATFLN